MVYAFLFNELHTFSSKTKLTYADFIEMYRSKPFIWKMSTFFN